MPILTVKLKLACSKPRRRADWERSFMLYQVASDASVASIALPGMTIGLDDKAPKIYGDFRQDADVQACFVLDANGFPCGIVTRSHLLDLFGGRYGFSLHTRSTVADIMESDFLREPAAAPIKDVSNHAMQRPQRSLYDPVALLTAENTYAGMVTIRDLLLALVREEVETASDANPLTHLPGNHVIQRRIASLLAGDDDWTLVYIDVDNFKAFNDAYGFAVGDKVILSVANAMRESFAPDAFLGHVGGDDFVACLPRTDASEECHTLLRKFREKILPLYTPEDVKRGYIVSHNREGFERHFQIMTLSLAVISSSSVRPSSMDELSHVVALAKKRAKQQEGNAISVA